MGQPLPSQKDEYPPLLEIGRHQLSMDALGALCVKPFPQSERRPWLMGNLRRVVRALEDAGVVGELWIDGSFLTRKIEPDDVDLLLVFDGPEARHRPRMRHGIEWFMQPGMKPTLGCHPNSLADYRRGPAALAKQSEHWYSYWVRQWGFTRNDQPKGFAVHRLVRRDLAAHWRAADLTRKASHDGPWKHNRWGSSR